MNSKNTVLITGGTGFFGYHMSQYLSKKKIHHVLYDLHPLPHGEKVTSYATVVLGDVRDTKALTHVLKGVEYVVHAAAALPLAKPEEIHDTNVNGTKNVLSCARRSGVKKIIYISSTAVYGVPKIHPIDESAPYVGVGPYGISKIEAEKLCFNAINKKQNITIIRPKTFVGTTRLGVFEILFDWIHDGVRIPLIGNGENRYQLLEVTDLCDSVWSAALSTSKKTLGAFNVGATRFKTIAEDLTEFFIEVNSRSRVMPIPAALVKTPLRIAEALHLSPLYQWVYDTADKDSFVSTEKAQKILSWKPKYSNSEALARAYKWYEKHYDEIKARGTGTTHTVGWKQGILGVAKVILNFKF